MKQWHILLFPLLLGAAGCVDITYVGQSFPAEPENREIAFFPPDVPVPPGEYRTIGRATLTAPESTESEELRDELIESARKHGADAVQVVEFKRVYVGDRATPSGAMQEPSSSWMRDGRYPDGSYIYTDTFGTASALEQPPTPVYDIVIKALYLISNARFEALTAAHRQELDAVARQLDPNADKPLGDRELNAALEQGAAAQTAAEPVAPRTEKEKRSDSPAEPTRIQLRTEPVAL